MTIFITKSDFLFTFCQTRHASGLRIQAKKIFINAIIWSFAKGGAAVWLMKNEWSVPWTILWCVPTQIITTKIIVARKMRLIATRKEVLDHAIIQVVVCPHQGKMIDLTIFISSLINLHRTQLFPVMYHLPT